MEDGTAGEEDSGDEDTATGPGVPEDAPDFEVRYSTKYVDVAPGFSSPVCEGTLREFDRHIEGVAGLLNIEPQTRIVFYFFNSFASGAYPTDGIQRCTPCHRSVGYVYGTFRGRLHELTHAVVVPSWGRNDVLFEEGIALAFDGDHTLFDPDDMPTVIVGGEQQGGPHFTRWLLAEFGAEPYSELFTRLSNSSTRDEVFAVVEQIYGTSLPDLEADYLLSKPTLYPAPWSCDGLDVIPWSDATTWELERDVDCTDPDVFGPRGVVDGSTYAAGYYHASVLIDVPPNAGIRAPISSPSNMIVKFTPCLDEPSYDDPPPAPFYLSEAIGFPAGVGAMRYRADFPVAPGSSIDFELAIDLP